MKRYDFRFVVRQANMDGVFVQIVFGGPATVYRDECQQMTLADAKAFAEKICKEEPRSNATSISMKSRADRKPPGYNKLPPYFFNQGAQA